MGDLLEFPTHRAVGSLNYEITKRELAARWRVSERWIELRMREDGLPYRKDSRSRLVRFPLAECELWLHRRRAS